MPILNRDDCPIYFEQFGPSVQTDLPRLLLIQGIGVRGSGWGPQVHGLKKSCSIVTFDNRGIGRSVPCSGPITVETMADDAIAVLDHMGWSTAHIAGHSLGGVVAQQLALNHPKRVDSLSLFCTFARGVDGARATPRVIWLGIRSRVGTRAMRRRAFVEMLWPSDALAKMDSVRLADDLALVVGRDLADFLPVMNLQLKALGAHDVSSRLIELGNFLRLSSAGRVTL